eukprot:GHVS01085007.1.p1 GENE.GHVS01085007.1~~GHVS01085007.1.p1  ORF type:complete len:350 (-),score=57.23 GHVS01085007.1:343-1392(-)
MPSSPLAPIYDRRLFLKQESAEALLKDNPARWVILPIKFPSVWKLFKKHEHDFWTAEQIVDQFGWSPADPPFQTVAIRLITAEVGSDMFSQMIEWICDLLERTTSAEARAFYGFECAFTTIHHEALSLLLAKVPEVQEAMPQQNTAGGEDSALSKKRHWITFLLNQEHLPFAEMILIHALIKSVMNASRCLLCALLRSHSQLPAVESVLRRLTETERLHCKFSALCYSLLKSRLPTPHVNGLVQKCVEIEQQYGLEIFFGGTDVFKIQKDDFNSYIQYVGDSVLTAFGGTSTETKSNVFAAIMKADCCTVPPLLSNDATEESAEGAEKAEEHRQSHKLGGSKFDTECEF